MKMKTTAMVLALMCNPVGAQSDYIDGEFEGRMGWMPNSGGSPEYYLGYFDGREEHEDIGDLLREMYEESDRERRWGNRCWRGYPGGPSFGGEGCRR